MKLTTRKVQVAAAREKIDEFRFCFYIFKVHLAKNKTFGAIILDSF